MAPHARLSLSRLYQKRQRAGGRRQKGNTGSCPLPVTEGNKGLRPPPNSRWVALVQEGSQSPCVHRLLPSAFFNLVSSITFVFAVVASTKISPVNNRLGIKICRFNPVSSSTLKINHQFLLERSVPSSNLLQKFITSSVKIQHFFCQCQVSVKA